MAFAQQKTIREDLEEQVEYWRQRAEKAEAELAELKGEALPFSDPARDWWIAISPLTLSQTRIMRLLALGRPMTIREIADVMVDYGRAEYADGSVKTATSVCRNSLPVRIAPTKANKWFAPITVPDITALRAFLGESTPDIRRVA